MSDKPKKKHPWRRYVKDELGREKKRREDKAGGKKRNRKEQRGGRRQ